MSVWLLLALLLLPPFAVAVFVAMRADCDNRLVATQLASGFAALDLAAMSFAFDQPFFMDIALCLVLFSIAGTYMFGIFMERWL